MPITTFKLRRGTASEWTTANPVLGAGEPGFEIDTNRLKIGNGTSPWAALDYYFSQAALVSMLTTFFAAKSVETLTTSGRLSNASLVTQINSLIGAAAVVSTTGATDGEIPIWDSSAGKFIPGPAPTGGTTAPDVEPVPILFSADVPTLGTTGSSRARAARTITEARMRAGSGPVGSNLTAILQHWNGTAWSTITTLDMPAGTSAEVAVTGLTQAQAIGNLVRLNVTSIGSTTPASDVVVEVVFTS